MKTYKRPSTLMKEGQNSFCPGCMHSIIGKLISEVLDELGQADNAIELLGIGCCGIRQQYVDIDQLFCAHGRACASATGIKRTRPENLVSVSYTHLDVYKRQGEGSRNFGFAASGLADENKIVD